MEDLIMTKDNNLEIPKIKILIQVIIRYILSLIFASVLLFLPAGSLKFWNAWVFLSALFIPMLFVLIYLIIKDPELLQKRIKTNEKEKSQKIYLVLSIITILITFIVPGLDFKNHWSQIPDWLVIVATVIMILGYYMFFMVMKQNRYASRVIEIQKGQKVIDFGLYSIVRHPMYLAATILFCSIPIILGSLYGLIPVFLIPLLLIIRILNEEKVLKENLNGYSEYMKKVKYRLIPFIW
jgi:protein-S-isoprenylcysteine O-methyltransferase Ste14